MIMYYVGLVFAVVIWGVISVPLIADAFTYRDADKARKARWALLALVLLPVYPAGVVVVLVFGLITLFRQLGRISKNDKEKETE